MGIDAKATGYMCESCKTSFTPEEVRQLRQTESDRLQALEGQDVASES
jgi:hypothetical protein